MKSAFLPSIALTLLCAGSAGAETYVVEPRASEIRILVYRGGMLGRLGHNHIVSVDDITGTVTVGETAAESSIELRFDVQDLVVDDPALRRAEGDDFPGEISEKDKAGTRGNMLGPKLLDAEKHGEIRIASSRVLGDYPDLTIEAEVWVKGSLNRVAFPATVERSAAALTATGELVVSHADLGLRPFKAALGALRVRDGLLLKYRLEASKADQ